MQCNRCGIYYFSEVECPCWETHKKKDRPSKDEYWMNLLDGVKSRASCPRRQAGALIVDDRNMIIASGYNGPPIGFDNCTEVPCEGVNDVSGNSDRCLAVHAEANAIIHAGDKIRYAITMYCTTKPCFNCAKLICQTPISRLIYLEDYPDIRGNKVLFHKHIEVIKWQNK